MSLEQRLRKGFESINEKETIKQLSEELKPCPFCGGKAQIERYGNNRQSMQIRCEDCGCFLETGETWIDENCHWNKRV